ncbi:MAG TPA: MBOAT family O-acyltransferase [Bacteroidia bacterium]|nr:MBOAT family O-acyltransferase [Bacteroidia bacterium]
MVFNSFNFFIFFIAVVTLYFSIPHRFRWALLLIASCMFYMFLIPVYIFIIWATIIIDYFMGICIEKGGSKKKLYLLLSIVANLSILAFFKYYNFLNENLGVILHGVGYRNLLPYLNIALPIGLSFHTFQAMSYTIDIYRGQQKAERHFGIYALYIMFFPQLVAGPIERAHNMLHQFYEKHYFNAERTISGLQLILWGLYKKVVVADTIAIYVNSIYDNPSSNNGLTLVIATYAFAFQIYCDFSGYSDIAVGSARILGFELTQNFRLPYFSKSVSEFWRRWHISFSTWLRDYLYIPLGGNRSGKIKMLRNILITMLLGGLWHGASWNFILWGALNGAYLCIEKMLSYFGVKALPWKLLKVFITFNLICFSWIFFRADTFHNASLIVRNIFSVHEFFNVRIQDVEIFVSMLVKIILLLAIEFFLLRKHSLDFSEKKHPWIWSLSFNTFLIILIVVFGVKEGTQFIYFQF